MLIQLKKTADGKPTLACVRADGTRTWRRVHPFFPVHDLLHCAVESVFGFNQAFFGLIAAGWSLDDFEERGMAARLPDEALWAENIVGLFDLERATGNRMSASDFTRTLSDKLSAQGRSEFRMVTDAELDRVRALVAELRGRWQGVAAGATFEVPFPAAAVASGEAVNTHSSRG